MLPASKPLDLVSLESSLAFFHVLIFQNSFPGNCKVTFTLVLRVLRVGPLLVILIEWYKLWWL